MKRILVVLAAAAIGYAGFRALWVVWAAQGQDGQGWQMLPPTPARVRAIVPTGQGPFVVTTIDGSTYYFEDWGDNRWIATTTDDGWTGPVDVVRPCNRTSSEYLFAVPRPQSVADCFQERTWYADGYIDWSIALDKEGRVWQWHWTTGPGSYLDPIWVPILGAILGLLVGLAATAMWSQMKTWGPERPAPSAPSDEPGASGR